MTPAAKRAIKLSGMHHRKSELLDMIRQEANRMIEYEGVDDSVFWSAAENIEQAIKALRNEDL